jgi:hypothetical protein
MSFTEEFPSKKTTAPIEPPQGAVVTAEVVEQLNNSFCSYGSLGLLLALAAVTGRYIYRKIKPKTIKKIY